MDAPFKLQSEKVAAYYNAWNEKYAKVYGSTIQAHRPASEQSLLDYCIQTAGLKDGQKILDAGCGYCGPSIYFARKLKVSIDALTISIKQVEEAGKKIAESKLNGSIQVKCGDYHELDNLYPANSFDRVLFLESLGHAGNAAKVIESAYKVTKPGGEIYIKDFYPKKTGNVDFQAKVERVVANLNNNYSYNALDLSETISALRKSNFEIVFIKQIEFINDAFIKNEFEKLFGISLFENMDEFYFAEWLELKCIKPFN